MQWRATRDRWTTAAAAVEASNHVEGLQALRHHPTVKAALASIDMAERSIASVADELLCKYYDEPEDV